MLSDIKNNRCKEVSISVNDLGKGVCQWTEFDRYTGSVLAGYCDEEESSICFINDQNKIKWKITIKKDEKGKLSTKIKQISSKYIAIQVNTTIDLNLPKQFLLVLNKSSRETLLKINLDSSPNNEFKLSSDQFIYIHGTPEGRQIEVFSLKNKRQIEKTNTLFSQYLSGESLIFNPINKNSLLITIKSTEIIESKKIDIDKNSKISTITKEDNQNLPEVIYQIYSVSDITVTTKKYLYFFNKKNVIALDSDTGKQKKLEPQDDDQKKLFLLFENHKDIIYKEFKNILFAGHSKSNVVVFFNLNTGKSTTLPLDKSHGGLKSIDISEGILIFQQKNSKGSPIHLYFFDFTRLMNSDSNSLIKVLKLKRKTDGHDILNPKILFFKRKIMIQFNGTIKILSYSANESEEFIKDDTWKIHTDDSDEETIGWDHSSTSSEDDIESTLKKVEENIKFKGKRLFSEVDSDDDSSDTDSIDREEAPFKNIISNNEDLKSKKISTTKKQKIVTGKKINTYQADLEVIKATFKNLLKKETFVSIYTSEEKLAIDPKNYENLETQFEEKMIFSLKMFKEAFAKLPKDQFYRMYIDFIRQVNRNPNLFDIREPGYRSGMERGFTFMSYTLGIEFNSILYTRLHDECIQNAKNKKDQFFTLGIRRGGRYGMSRYPPSKEVMEEWETDKLIFVEGVSKGEKEEYLSSYQFEEGFSHMLISNNAKNIFKNDISKIQKSLNESVDDLFSNYYLSVKKTKDIQEILICIAKLLKALSILHVFADANQRAIVFVLLNKLLIEQGFSPSIIKDPYCFDGWCSTNELVKHMIKGMKVFQYYCD